MRYISRNMEVDSVLKRKSLFLIGPRLTGKSTFIQEQVDTEFALVWNLLDGKLRYQVNTKPGLLKDEIEARELHDCAIYIDEIQKCPFLLDDIHLLIEERRIRFLLTGSSLYKLRQGGVNLLGGRASIRNFFPLNYQEVTSSSESDKISLTQMFETGMLPSIYLSEDFEDDMSAYIQTYLTEEVAAEGAVRNLDVFTRFLQTASLVSGQILNYQNVASDASLAPATVKNWFQILYDTLVGFEVPAYTHSVKRKAFTKSKFYLFDVGVMRYLRGVGVPSENSSDFGDFFEQYIAVELRTWIHYRSRRSTLRYWRSVNGVEVDFLIDETIAIEVKSSTQITRKHMKGLRALQEENIFRKYVIVCREDRPRRVDGIDILPWQYFLKDLWENTLA